MSPLLDPENGFSVRSIFGQLLPRSALGIATFFACVETHRGNAEWLGTLRPVLACTNDQLDQKYDLDTINRTLVDYVLEMKPSFSVLHLQVAVVLLLFTLVSSCCPVALKRNR